MSSRRSLLGSRLPPPDQAGRDALARAPASAAAVPSIASSEQAEMTALVAQMRAAARQAGLDDDGPLTPLLQALMLVLDRLGALADRNARLSDEHVAGIRQTLTAAREAADSETARFRAGLEATKAEVIFEIARKIAQSADAALTRRVRVFDRNTALIAAAVLFGSVLGAFLGGYWWGSSSAQAGIHETETGLQAAFNDGPKAAQDWLNLMTWNDVVYSLSLCRGDGISIQHGRTACMVPLWIEKPQAPPPPRTGG